MDNQRGRAADHPSRSDPGTTAHSLLSLVLPLPFPVLSDFLSSPPRASDEPLVLSPLVASYIPYRSRAESIRVSTPDSIIEIEIYGVDTIEMRHVSCTEYSIIINE